MTSPLRSPSMRFARFVRSVVLLGALVLPLTSVGTALGKPKVHVVYKGQRLGSIAKRYNVSIDELCKANNISRRDPIHPGQRLEIPGTDDGTGPSQEGPVKKPSGKARIHVVARGHTLSAIAGRYAVTVSALCNANGIGRNTTLEVGQKLVVPHKTDKNGAYARRQRERGVFDDKLEDEEDEKKEAREEKSWEKYVKPAWRRGYIKIRRYGRYWSGYVIGPKNQVLGHASNKINYVLGAKKDGPRIDPQLIRLIASISDKFGGREMRIVSGYRTKSYVAASKHKVGKALDFSIPGIPNEALRDYLRTIEGVGVGYYPNSSFVHLDVRGYNSYWVDYAGPGEPPRTRKRSASKSKGSKDSDSSKSKSESSASRSKTDESSTKEKDSSSRSPSKQDDSASKEGERSASKDTPRTSAQN